MIIYEQNKLGLLFIKRHCDVIGSNVVTGFWKLNIIISLNILNAKKSVGGHVKKSVTTTFFNKTKLYLAVRCKTFRKIKL